MLVCVQLPSVIHALTSGSTCPREKGHWTPEMTRLCFCSAACDNLHVVTQTVACVLIQVAMIQSRCILISATQFPLEFPTKFGTPEATSNNTLLCSATAVLAYR
ncbi:hypothetical protein H4582DRAFT_139395 [Lactarius indigo]|nr:hypothetical protein H4582DRAFT_139395 [Lactarius indigo]